MSNLGDVKEFSFDKFILKVRIPRNNVNKMGNQVNRQVIYHFPLIIIRSS